LPRNPTASDAEATTLPLHASPRAAEGRSLPLHASSRAAEARSLPLHASALRCRGNLTAPARLASRCRGKVAALHVSSCDAEGAFHTVRQDRHPLGERLTATFTTPHRRVRSGADVEIAVVLTNPADAPLVRWQRGGANRGPRDDQFDFTVTRDGQPLTNIEAMNFGGLSQFLPLAPGAASETLRVPLASWVDLSARGHYVVQCRYHTVFLPEGVEPYGEGTMGAFWDRTFEGTVTFDVR
jgi:hypothetical protein